ncbi:MAG TPA: gluconate 2-dehydrogenase subunit 3 family protein [Blastocatellia bacterium]|nr:gluconate 2-dehydrogenase subunit 3 family protein [Blastocatellia bacterium]
MNDSIGEETETPQESGEISRRELIKLGASAALLASVGASESARAASVATPAEPAPAFFTPEEFALVDELSELIIPADDHSPGARAAQVATYIDFRLSESWEEEPKQQWRNGLKLIESLSKEMHGKAFMQSTPEQRLALLTRIAQNEAKPHKPEEEFFRELKRRTVRAYYTSQIGIKQEIEYKGNAYLKEFVGTDVSGS